MDKLITNRIQSVALAQYAAKHRLSNDELQFLDVDLVQQEIRAQLAVKSSGYDAKFKVKK